MDEDGGARNDKNNKQRRRFVYSWVDFGSLLAQASKDWYERKKFAHNKMVAKRVSAAGRAYSRRRDLSVDGRAIELATMYAMDPKELAKKTVSLIERVRLFSNMGGNKKSRHSSHRTVDTWFSYELRRWAFSLGIADDRTGRPFCYASADFATQYPQYGHDDSLSCQSLFGVADCQAVLSQISFLTRLRSMFLKSWSGEAAVCSDIHMAVNSAITRTQSSQTTTASILWKRRPEWWEATPGDPFRHDALILDRLLTEGYLGILVDTGGFEAGQQQLPAKSLRQLGLTKGSI